MNSGDVDTKQAPVLSAANQVNPISNDAGGQPSLIFTPESYVQRLDLEQMFSAVQPLEVELGSGDGSFLAGYAKCNPAINFIAVERLLGRLRKLDRKGLRSNLSNLRVLRIEAKYFVEYLLPLESVSAVHIYFPDPWPKRKHRKHRLVNHEFVESLRLTLRDGGMVYLRTDDADYFKQMTGVFGENSEFQERDTPTELSERTTDFEKAFLSKGISTLRAAYQR